MPEKLTWDEIREKYPDEWVLIVDYELDDGEELTSGRVAAHSRIKHDLRESLARPDDAAFLFTGRVRPVAGVMVLFDEEI